MDVERLPQQYVDGKEKAEKKKIECRGTLGHRLFVVLGKVLLTGPVGSY